MARIRILVADDHEVVRQGLVSSFKLEADMEVVGIAALGEQAVRLATLKRPDILLLDVRFPDLDGPEVCRRVVDAAPQTAVIMLTSYRQDSMIRRSLKAGARGYLIKDIDLSEMKKMIRSVFRGNGAIDPSIARRVIEVATQPARPVTEVAALSEIDLAIIRHVARGLTNKQIAALVHRSPHTIKDRLEKISAALDARSRTEIVATAFKTGLI
jgi:DNA-binding NarL/FixJ family response regulator